MCGKCKEDFSSFEPHVPLLLSCGHTFCSGCLGKWLEGGGAVGGNGKGKGGRALRCPRKCFPTPVPKGMGSLKRNIPLLKYLSASALAVAVANSSSSSSSSSSSPSSPPSFSPVKCGGKDDCEREGEVYCPVCETCYCILCDESIHSFQAMSHHCRTGVEDRFFF